MNSFIKYDLHEDLIKSIANLKFKIPTLIQDKVIPKILSSKMDIIATAQTGTGKTAAFGLPLIHLTNNKIKMIEAIILCPTRELCIQITKDLNSYSQYFINYEVVSIYGGSRVDIQLRALKTNPKIIVCTPGRLNDLIKRKKINLDYIKYFVLDEADEMLSMGFKEEIDTIIDKTPIDKNIYLFSATISKKVQEISKEYMENPIRISAAVENSVPDDVKHIYYIVDKASRYKAIKRILDKNKDIYAIIFCRTRRETKEVSTKLMQDNYSANVLNGDLSQDERDYVMNQFRDLNIQILVATDVASRGIDVNNLTHVINFNLPDDPEVYIHRSGRTGRAGKDGVSITLLKRKEEKRLEEIEKLSKIQFQKDILPTKDEILKTQVYSFVDKIKTAEIKNKEIKKILPSIYSKLDSFTKEELILKFISLTISNRNIIHENNFHQSQKSDTSDEYKRLTINIGRKDKMNPENLIRLVKKTLRSRKIEIGKITIKKNSTTFQVKASMNEIIISKLNEIRYNRKKILFISDEENSIDIDSPKKSYFKKKKKKHKSRNNKFR